jgi:hypothetical protein
MSDQEREFGVEENPEGEEATPQRIERIEAVEPASGAYQRRVRSDRSSTTPGAESPLEPEMAAEADEVMGDLEQLLPDVLTGVVRGIGDALGNYRDVAATAPLERAFGIRHRIRGRLADVVGDLAEVDVDVEDEPGEREAELVRENMAITLRVGERILMRVNACNHDGHIMRSTSENSREFYHQGDLFEIPGFELPPERLHLILGYHIGTNLEFQRAFVIRPGERPPGVVGTRVFREWYVCVTDLLPPGERASWRERDAENVVEVGVRHAADVPDDEDFMVGDPSPAGPHKEEK